MDASLGAHHDELIAFRRNLHSHPELSRAEHQTSSLVAQRLEVAGLEPRTLPTGTGVVCDIGDGDGPVVALRADLDALPVPDEKDVHYRSEVPGVAHACGHDVHTTIVLGTGLAVASQRGDPDRPPGRVRLIFQPAEESIPGGALDVIEAGWLDGVDVIYALHCDPSLPVGKVGLRAGAITSAGDRLEIRLFGPGGHTARPHLTTDLVHVAARVVADLPAGLGRLVSVKHGVNLVFGSIHAGGAPNVIPTTATIAGTMRAMGRQAWDEAPKLIERLLDGIVGPFGASYELDYQRGSPPIENHPRATAVLGEAARTALGADAVAPTEQSLGGEDFSWYLDHVPGAYGRLGVRRADDDAPLDLHAGNFDVDEAAIGAGVRLLTEVASASLRGWRPVS
jgi:amidohydrolase